jgi:hypothetical protein
MSILPSHSFFVAHHNYEKSGSFCFKLQEDFNLCVSKHLEGTTTGTHQVTRLSNAAELSDGF